MGEEKFHICVFKFGSITCEIVQGLGQGVVCVGEYIMDCGGVQGRIRDGGEGGRSV